MRVNELAKQLGVTADTVRFYTRNNVLNPTISQGNGYKYYSAKDSKRLRFVLSARQLGFSVNDIKEILAQADNTLSPCSTVRRLIEHRLAETEKLFLATQRLRDRMKQAIKAWDKQPNQGPSQHEICHLIESFSLATEAENKEPNHG